MSRSKKKGFLSFVSVTLALLIQLSVLTPILASAAGNPFETSPFITGITLTDVTTGQQLGGSGAVAGKTDTVQIKYDFAIPDNVTIPNGTQYTFTVPNQISIPSTGFTEPLTMTDSGGNQVEIASISISPSGNGTITFNGSASNYSGVTGYFYVESKFAGDGIANTTPVPLSFTLEGQADPTTINVYFKQPATELDKSNGTYHADTNTVSWTVTVNANKTTVNDGKFTDTIPAGLSYVAGTFTVKDGSGNTVYKDGGANTLGSFQGTSNPFEYDFGQTVSDTYTITYDTAVDPNYFGQKLTNQSRLDHDGTSVTASGTVTPSPVYISKTGSYAANAGSGQINWTITFNQAGGILGNVAVTDNLPTGLTLTGPVILDKGAGSETTLTQDSSSSQYYSCQGNQLVYHADTVTGQHTLSFSTDFSPDYWQQNRNGISNSATLTSDSNSYLKNGVSAGSGIVPGTGNTVISKDGVNYNAAAHTITWKITVNSSKQALHSPTVTDDIPAGTGNAQTYVPGSFTVADKDGNVVYSDGGSSNTLGSFTYTATGGNTTKTGTLQYTFGGNISDTYTITYQTTVTEASVYAANTDKTYTNNAVLATSDGIQSSDGGNQEVKSTVIEKSANYDYINRELTWNITVNKNQMPMTGVKVTDVLTGSSTGLDDFTLEKSTISVGGSPLSEGTSVGSLTEGQYYYDTGTKTLTVYLGDIGTASKAITFKMSLNDPNTYFAANDSKSVNNTALLNDNLYGPVSVTTGYTIKNGVVTKSGDYTANSNYIDWIVHINKNAIMLSDLTLKDQLPDGLILDTSSIRLYPQALGANGVLTPDGSTANGIDTAAQSNGVTAVSLSGSNISYTAANREFDFTLPSDSGSGTTSDPYAISKPYVLIFRTYVDEAHRSGTFTNTINFSGNASTQSSTSSPVAVWYASGGGGATGSTGTLNVTKSDSVSGTPLQNAEFGLYDQYGNLLQTAVSDSNGKLAISFLQYSVPYTIKELTAPNNYKASSVIHNFELKKGSAAGLYEYDSTTHDYTKLISSTPAYAYTDDLLAGTIQLTKADQDGNPLPNVTFTLCDSSGNPVHLDGVNTVVQSDSLGKVVFTGIPYGHYLIKETAPADYTAGGPITADLTYDHVVSNTLDLGTVTNTIKTAGISFTKTGTGGVKLPGATFTLCHDADGKNPVLMSGTTVTKTSDVNGLVQFQNTIPYGDYYLVETAPPSDYTPVSPIRVSLHDSNSALSSGILSLGTVSDTLKLGTITFTKLDDSGNGLPGATFVLKDTNGNPVGSPQISDQNGKVSFTDVPYGDGYSITETQAPADFNVLSAAITGISLHSPEVTLQSVTDSRLTGSIAFTKVDENGRPLTGAEFTLYNPDGTQVETARISDESGKVTFTNVPFKDGYTVKETKAPENYAVHAAFTVNLHTATYDYGNVVDTLLRGSIKVTKTDPAGHPLAGSTFTLYDAGGKVVGQLVSSFTGIAVFDNLPYGNYTIQETKAPEGYNIDPNPHPVSLNAQNPAPDIKIIDTELPAAPVVPNPDTGTDRHFPLAETGILALTSGGIIASGKIRSGKRKKK